MKRIVLSFLLLAGLVVPASCGYDDGGEIPFINPIDSTATGQAQLPVIATTDSILDKKLD